MLEPRVEGIKVIGVDEGTVLCGATVAVHGEVAASGTGVNKSGIVVDEVETAGFIASGNWSWAMLEPPVEGIEVIGVEGAVKGTVLSVVMTIHDDVEELAVALDAAAWSWSMEHSTS